MRFSSLSKLFAYHSKMKSSVTTVERDLVSILQKGQSITSLAKIIYAMGIHIGTWREFKSCHKLRMAIKYNPRYRPFPLKRAKKTRVVKQCLVECHLDSE